MQNFITRDQLTDFVERMWDAGIKCDLKPEQSSITLWSKDFEKVKYVDVINERSYGELVREVQCSLLPKDNGINTCTQER